MKFCGSKQSATVVGTYIQGFSIIIERFDERMTQIPDPVLQVCNGQLPVSTKFDLRSDHGVERNYGRLLPELLSVVPDGIDKMQHKLVFIEIQDVVETMPDNYRRACACGRGAIFSRIDSKRE
ncbi:hypothetical protein LguiB_033027 [Lonicera macranthoides]